MTTAREDEEESLTLRVSGLGHTMTLQLSSTATVGDLKNEIMKQTDLPVFYQRLICRGIKLDDENNNDQTLVDIGMKNRTKIMLLHNAVYAKDKDGYEVLSKIDKEIDDLSLKRKNGEIITNATALSEFVTRICCRLDAIDVTGSDNLRQYRKDLLKKAEHIDSSSSSGVEDEEGG